MDNWEIIEEKSLSECIPLKGIIELNYFCDFSCVYCYLQDKRQQQASLNREQCRGIFASLRKAGALVLTFTGGEPLLNKDFEGILSDAREAGFAVRLFTNGSLVTDEKAAFLKGIKPLSVDVTLYGASEKTYETLTGNREHFEKTLKGLEALVRNEVHTVIKAVANRENIDEIPQIEKIADDLGINSVITPLLTPADCGDMSPCSYMLKEEELEDYFKSINRPLPNVNRADDEIICTSGRNGFVISPDGEVFPCIQIRKSAGNVLKTDFKTLWNDEPSDLLNEIRSLKFSDFKECTSCEYVSHCLFCPGLAEMESGSLTGKNLTACAFSEALAKIHGNNPE